MIEIPIDIGDTIYTGKWKNKKTVVKTIGKDENGQPTINDRTILKFKYTPKPNIFEKEKMKEEKMKLKKILNELLEITPEEKEKIKIEVLNILKLNHLSFNDEFLTIQTPNTINDLLINLPVLPDEKVKKQIINFMKELDYKYDPSKDAKNKDLKAHRKYSMAFKK